MQNEKILISLKFRTLKTSYLDTCGEGNMTVSAVNLMKRSTTPVTVDRISNIMYIVLLEAYGLQVS